MESPKFANGILTDPRQVGSA